MRTHPIVLLSLAALLAIPACVLGPLEHDAEPELERERLAIVGGGPTSDYPAVANIVTVIGSEASACSSTLISPRVLLTAAHCLDLGPGEPTQQYAYFGTRTRGGDAGFIERINIIDQIYPSNWTIENGGAHDIAMVLLEHDSVVEPMEINRVPLTGSDIGRALHLVGWGDTDSGAGDSGVKREVTSGISGYNNSFVLRYGTSNANTCQGDSGGPGFIQTPGGERIASITSFGTGGCRGTSGGTRVAQYVDYIDSWVTAKDQPIPPTCDILSPQEGAVVKSGFPVRVEATDNTRVDRVEIWIDGTHLTNLTLQPYIANTPALPDGPHLVEARAYDNREDVTIDRVMVTVDSSCQQSSDCLGRLICEDNVCVDPPPAEGDLGASCVEDYECLSDLCGHGADGSFCTELCDPEASECPSGFRCARAGETGVCWPESGGGCATAGAGGGAWGLFGVLLLAALARRPHARWRRRRSTSAGPGTR